MFTNFAKDLKKAQNLVGHIYIGEVVDNDDPDKLGRVRVRVEYLFGTDDDDHVPNSDLPWWVIKSPVGLGAAHDSSGLVIPEKGNLVTIMFPYEDIHSGIVDGVIRTKPTRIEPGETSVATPERSELEDSRKVSNSQYDYPDYEPDTDHGTQGATHTLQDDWKVNMYDDDYPENYGWMDKIGNWLKINKIKRTFEAVHSSGSKFKIDQEGNATLHITGNFKLIVEKDYVTQCVNGGHIYRGGRFTRVTNNEQTKVGAGTIHKSGNDNKINAANILLNC